jgi:hypothetical protein
MCHVQSLEKDVYLGALGSFDCDFTLLVINYKKIAMNVLKKTFENFWF